MNEQDAVLSAIRERCDAATEGPWYVSGSGWLCSRPNRVVLLDGAVSDMYASRTPDAEFIAHARTDVPVLLDLVDRLQDLLLDAETSLEMHEAYVAELVAPPVPLGDLGVS